MMDITIRQFNQSDEKSWDEFVNSSSNGTIFHLRKFLSYHIDRQFVDQSLIFEKKGNIIAIFPAAIIENEKKRILFSHPGASFGGFVYQKLNFRESEAIIKTLEKFIYNKKIDKLFFIPTPSIYSCDRDETMEYTLIWNNYMPIENYISSIITINPNKEKNINEICRLKNRTKNYYKKIIQKNNIVFKWENDFDTFYPILINNKSKHNSSPTHSINELKKIDKILPGKLELLLMYSDDKPIGGSLLINANKRVRIIFYNMVDYNYVHLQPATLQSIEIISNSSSKNIYTLDFGVSHNPSLENPLTPSKSLIQFKEEMGGFAIIRKAYSKIFKI